MAVTEPPAAVPDEDAQLAGLDALDTEVVASRPAWRRAVSVGLPPLVAAFLVLAAWQLLYDADIKPATTLPSPHEVFTSLRGLWDGGTLPSAIRNSLTRGGLGFLAALAIGTPLGLVLGRVRVVRAAIGPIVSGLQSLPSVAWVPVGIIWFGLNASTEYFVILMGAVPSIANGMVSGLDQVPPLYLRVGHVLGARGLTMARHVLLPAAMPAYVGGLRQGWAFAWRSLMAAELITISYHLTGLGALLNQGQEQNDIAWVLGVILVILGVGIAVEMLVFRPLERKVLRSRGLLAAR